MAHAIIPKSSSTCCNVTTSHTTPAAHIIQDGFVERMVGVAKKLTKMKDIIAIENVQCQATKFLPTLKDMSYEKG